MQIVEVNAVGGPENLILKDAPIPVPGPRDVVIEHKAVGVNFVDIYHRSGVYAVPLPFTPGIEGSGLVHSTGADVDGVSPGDRVVYAAVPPGSYATHRRVSADRIIALPATIPFDVAAAGFVRAMTAHLLLSLVHPVEPGMNVLIHAAAGGLGMLLCSQATRLGARVIGTVSTTDKAQMAKKSGAERVIVGRDTDFVAAVHELTAGGVDLVVDGLGGGVLAKSLGCVRPFGTVASVGQATGPVTPIELASLPPNVRLVRPSIIGHISDVTDYRAVAASALEILQKRGPGIAISNRYQLSEIRQAHLALETGATVGCSVVDI